tara:strand:- start:1704 stop:1967 length:264 start_codon:yes stop_codon:yes gene_type:complete
MTVRELIKVLTEIEDQEVRVMVSVMVSGYEGGYNDIVIGNGIDNNIPAIVNVALDVNEEWYYGAHERVGDMYDAANIEYQIVKAIII